MGQEQARQLLQQGIAAARAGQTENARDLFRQAARLDPQNETTWMWLTSVAEDTNERIFCLKRILDINPHNEKAIQGLQALAQTDAPASPVTPAPAAPTPTPTPTPAPAPAVGPRPTPPPTPQGISVPRMDEQKSVQLQQAADDFLRQYNPEPVDRMQIEWVHKARGRYAEMGEQRMRRVIVSVAAVVIVGVLIGAVVIASQLDISIGGGKATEVSQRVESPTPTLEHTPTPGGATPTPFPAQMAVPATAIPLGLEQQGNAYAVKTPTEMYPPINSFVERVVNDAVDFYVIGDYDAAIERLRKEREADANCYPSVVYFEALSMAAQGDYSDATDLLNESISTNPGSGYASCRDSELLLAGLGEVAYLRDNESQLALDYAEQALAQDSHLVRAYLTKARVEFARSEYQVARRTLQTPLNEYPSDTNVLLLLAQIELADGDLSKALEYVGKALFVEPVLHEALQLQAQIYLSLAGQAPSGSEQELEYYGLAVVSARTLQGYYEGDPVGYLYLAQALLGEGKADLAEEAVSRVLAVADDLPDTYEPAVREARRIRGYMYYDQGRFQDAWDDLEPIAVTKGALDVAVAETLVDIAFRLEEYVDALDWIEQLRYEDTENATYLLREAKIRVEICTFRADLLCQYDDMLEVLDDAFINSLDDPALQADAYAYRAQALYGDALERETISEDEQLEAFRSAWRDLDRALAMRENALDHYYRALILDALDEPVEALKEYEWLTYWNEQYAYPFVNDEFEQSAADVADVVEATIAAQATATPAPLPTQPRITATPTPGPTSTPTATPEPTAIPPEQIP